MKIKKSITVSLLVPAALVLSACGDKGGAPPKDEGAWIRDTQGDDKVPQNPAGTFYPTHAADAFKGMDSHVKDVYGADFSPDQIEGRNTWVMWTGGNQQFWDYLARNSNGIVDFLKLLDSRFIKRKDRFPIMGVVPNPGMTERSPDPDAEPPKDEWTKFPYYGLSLDDGITSEAAYAEGPIPAAKTYGYSSGIVGLRLFPRETDPDPRVREEWEKNKHKWNPVRYLKDEQYYKDPDLIRPYRIGMSCGFCHVQANPMNPPKDMTYAKWENLSSNIGQQYFWFGRIFGADFKSNNLLWYFTNYPEPGSLDTSLVATDGNNNPNTMNGVFQLLPRVVASLQSDPEKQSEDTLKYMPRLDQGWDFKKGKIVDDLPSPGPNDVLPVRFTPEEQPFVAYLGLPEPHDRLPPLGKDDLRHTPKILAGGADSIGGRGALCRVYLNIGEYGEQWVTLQNTMVGIAPQKPFKMEDCAENSLNWSVTMRRSTNVAKYFLANSIPMRLENAIKTKAPSLNGYVLPNDDPKVLRGAEVFARDCFVCHSSLNQPDGFWKSPHDWKEWAQTENYAENAAKWITDLLKEPVTGDAPRDDPFFEGFVKMNYLSTDARYPVDEIGTNSARSIADNAGSETRMWADYSSYDFKLQKKLDTTIEIAHPYKENVKIDWPLTKEAGPGRYRPHSLSSMWAHGPYLHNNSVGYYPYEWGDDPRYQLKGAEKEKISWFVDGIQSIESRVKIFEDGARRLLGLKSAPSAEAREYRNFSDEPRRGYDSIVRTVKDSEVILPKAIIGDLFYMQTKAIIGIGIPRWVLIAILAIALIIGIRLFIKGARRIRQGKGGGLRNVALLVLGVVAVGLVISLWEKQHIKLGYIPKGTPVNLIANINGPDWILGDSEGAKERKKLVRKVLLGLFKAQKRKVKSLDEIDGLVENLIKLSKNPDLILDKGHDFGIYNTVELAKGNQVQVPEEDREALIEFLKKL